MALESATYINQLVNTNPTGADPKGQGDDHVRMLKRVLQSTFPNINAAVTVTPSQLNALSTPNQFVVPGMIVMWSGSLSSLPAGWLLCNGVGTISTGATVPDLRDKFIVGAGASFPVRSTGGASAYTFSGTTSSSVVTTVVPTTGWGTSGGKPGTIPNGRLVTGSGAFEITEELESIRAAGADRTLSSASHSHTWTSSAQTIRPPYVALGFIIKQ